MEATYGLYNSAGEIVSDVHSVSAENKHEALIAMCLRYNHENHDTGYATDGDEIYEYQGFDPEDDDCMKDFPGFNPDVDPFLDPDKYDTDKFYDKYCYEDLLSVDLCYTLIRNDEDDFEDSELGCYENEADARRAASVRKEFLFDDGKFTVKDPDGYRNYSLLVGVKGHDDDYKSGRWNDDYYSDWFESDDEALENLKDWMRNYEFDAISDDDETVELEDIEGGCFCDDRLVGTVDGSDLSDELTEKAEQEQVAKPSLADVKKEVAKKRETMDEAGTKARNHGR